MEKGLSFLPLLTLLFIALKLLGSITWSWWWVLSPVWLPIVVALVVAAVVFGVAFIIGLIKG